MTTQITQLPPAPQHTDSPAVFSTKGDNFIAALPQFVTETNQLAVDLNTAMNSAYLGNTATSTTSVTIGTGTKNFTVEANKNFVKGMTLKIAFDATNYMIGEITSYNSSTGALAISVITTLGSGTYAVWSVSPTVYYTPSSFVNVILSATTLDSTYSGRLINLSGNFNLSFAASATLKNGWYVWLRNTGLRNITLIPNGAELIDGATTGILTGGTTALIFCNGSSLRFVNIVNADTPSKGYNNRVLVTSTSNFSIPAGVTRLRIYAVGKGGDGHATNGSGGGGGLAWGDLEVFEAARILPITINSSSTTVMYNSTLAYQANAASGITGGTATISSGIFNGGASTGGTGGGVGGASSGTIFGTGVAGSAAAGAGGSGWGGNGGFGGGGGIGSASSGAFSGGTGANQGGRGILDPFTDPLILTFNGVGQPPIIGTSPYYSPYYSPDGVGGCYVSNNVSGNPATAGNGGFGAGGGGSNVSVGAGISTAGNGGFGGGGGGAIAQTGGIAQAGAGGYGGGGGKASGGSTNNQGAGGAGAVIILY